MVKKIVLMLLIASGLTVIAPLGYCQDDDDEAVLHQEDEEERLEAEEFYEQTQLLKQNIQEGWTKAQVSGIMGPPEIVQNSNDGLDVIEIWGYDGFEVRIEFRNGLVEKWFVRFGGTPYEPDEDEDDEDDEDEDD
jgi:hypothetical protein